MKETFSETIKEKSIAVVKDFLLAKRNVLAAIGLLLVFPATIIVSVGLMNATGFEAPNDWLTEIIRKNAFAKWAFDTFLHPIVVLGGLLIAFAGNLVTLLQLKIEAQDLVFTATVSLKDRARNTALVALSAFLSCAIMAYVFVENFRIVPR